MSRTIKTRMAPSPTGNYHVGSARTAIYNYLFARHHGGEFILRSEDTDKARSKPEHEQYMLDSHAWLGLDHDAFYRQSERTDIYVEHIQKLIAGGYAYEAEGSKDNPDKPVIRFKNPNTTITFTDVVLGEITTDTAELGDFVIARDIETPLYHLTVVVDDGLMDITHIFRGQEHVANTPRQILILEALGFERPVYVHLPVILSPRGGKLSKSDPEVQPFLEYKNLGVEPDALLNFLTFIGWNPGTEQEVFSKEELIAAFDETKIQKKGSVFNYDKLRWYNKEHLKLKTPEEFRSASASFWPESISLELQETLTPVIRERVEIYSDITTMADTGEFAFYDPAALMEIDPSVLVWKKGTPEDTKRHLKHIHTVLSDVTEDVFTSEGVKDALWSYAESEGKGDVLWPLRYSLTGKERSPDPFTVAAILGKNITLQRIADALDIV